MPLHEPMRNNIKSQIADFVNAADGLGGAITAALYLSEFIYPIETKTDKEKVDETDEIKIEDIDTRKNDIPIETEKSKMVWFHVDFPGSEPRGMKTVYEYIKSEYVKDLIK
jgi:hypothetical protein